MQRWQVDTEESDIEPAISTALTYYKVHSVFMVAHAMSCHFSVANIYTYPL